MVLGRLPEFAAWRHHGAREGFEVVFVRTDPQGRRFEGCSTGVEGPRAWVVEYAVVVDADWVTRQVHVRARSTGGRREVRLESTAAGEWLVDGASAPHLAGCVDV